MKELYICETNYYKMKNLLLTALLAFVGTNAFSQGDCSAVIQTKEFSAGQMTTLKQDINVAKGANDGIKIALFRKSTVMLNITPLGDKVKCVDEKATMWIFLSDGTNFKAPHRGKMNCEGDFVTMFSEVFENKADLEKLKTKKITKISIMYSYLINEKIEFKVEEFELQDAQSTALMQGFNCITK